MDPTLLSQILTALDGRHYLALTILVTVYLRKLASPTSKFPLNIPTTWLSTVSAFGGLVYGFEVSLQDGVPVGTAVLTAVALAASTGFFDGLLTAIFAHGQAPAWARAIVGVFDDVAGPSSSGTGSFAAPNGSPKTDPPKPPAAARVRQFVSSMLARRAFQVFGLALGALVLTTVMGSMQIGCAQLTALIPELTNIENKICTDLAAGDGDTQIVNDVMTILGASATVEEVTDLVLSTITNLLSSGLLAKHYSAATVAQAKTIQSTLIIKVASRHVVK